MFYAQSAITVISGRIVFRRRTCLKLFQSIENKRDVKVEMPYQFVQQPSTTFNGISTMKSSCEKNIVRLSLSLFAQRNTIAFPDINVP